MQLPRVREAYETLGTRHRCWNRNQIGVQSPRCGDEFLAISGVQRRTVTRASPFVPSPSASINRRASRGCRSPSKATTGDRGAVQSANEAIAHSSEGRGVSPGDTRARQFSPLLLASHAQRRPGREPRRHRPARWRRAAPAGSLNEGRGGNPGDTCSSSPPRATGPLNEGRGGNPGDTTAGGLGRATSSPRSTKAGAGTPATLRHAEGLAMGSGRLTRAGAGTPATHPEVAPIAHATQSAQRRPGREPRRHGVDRVQSYERNNAQRRPGREPRRHGRARRGHAQLVDRSTKAGAGTGAGTPATPATTRACASRAARSTKAGAWNPGDTGASWDAGCRLRAAQRRPGREPRRHTRHQHGQLTDDPRSTKAGA